MAFFNEWRNTDEFRQEAQKFLKSGYYIEYPEDTYEYEAYWDEQEKYIKEGFTNSVGQHICGLHYLYLNFVMIYNKSEKKITLPDFWDTDAWVFDEMESAIIAGEHLAILKARQKGGSLKAIVPLLKRFYFDRNSMNYLGAFIEDKADRAWEMLSHMANHLDRHTPWKKSRNPDKKDFWKAQFQEVVGNKKVMSGFKSELHKVTFKQNPSYGVGGAIDTFVYDEVGLAPTVDKTLEYLDPACSDGTLRTGIVIMVGSVGELKDCQAFKKIYYKPGENACREFDNTWDKDGLGQKCGLFIPEYYSLKGFIDEHGNSMLEEARAWCEKERDKKKKKDPEGYRLYISQHPFSPEEAFAQRKESDFPVQLIDNEMHRIQNENLWGIPVDLEYNEAGKLYPIYSTSKREIRDFPVVHETDKRGAIIIYKHPPKEGAQYGRYFAGVDTVKNIKTTTSVSLSSCCIFERKTLQNGIFVGDEVVAFYTGRYDDPKKHNEEMEKLIEYYNASALVENNVSSFIEHMIQKKKQRYLLKKTDVALIQEMNLNANTHAVYGITTSTASKPKLLELVIEFLKEELEKVFDDVTGEVTKIVRGVNRVKDYMLLTEMVEYHDELNVDRIDAFGYALMAARSAAQHMDMIVKDNQYDYVEENRNINKLSVNTPFTGYNRANMMFNNPGLIKHSKPFRNIR